jgi:hypothetical protein
MYKIIEGRGTGKTKRLMEEAYNHKGIFVCQNAMHMREKANAYGFTGLQIMSFKDFVEETKEHEFEYTSIRAKGFHDDCGRKVYIDELEDFVNYLCFNKFKGYTISETYYEI